jgi:SAM-dependent methyltransferase
MEHVDYDAWAAYVHEILQEFAPDTKTIVELGCGTGSFALALREIATYQYAGTDIVPEMVRVAKAKAGMFGADLQFEVADFTDFHLDRPVDSLILLYDGLNYVTESNRLARLFACAYVALKPGGLFVFDQSTPANSVNNQAYFEDAGEAEGFSYKRLSSYDAGTRIHTTRFEIGFEGHEFLEEHQQRAYDLVEIRALVEDAGLVVEAIFDGFGRGKAGPATERAHWVVRRPRA